jgi:hypothetical protein
MKQLVAAVTAVTRNYHNNEIFNLQENASETGKPVSILDKING